MDLLLFKTENVVLWDIKLLNPGQYMEPKQVPLHICYIEIYQEMSSEPIVVL